MSRDQRVRDNWALWYAQQTALEKQSPLLVVFGLMPAFLGAGLRQYGFMLKGLEEVAKTLELKHIPFYCLTGNPRDVLPPWIRAMKGGCLITDFDPLRIKRTAKEEVAKVIEIPFLEVDAHNIVPCWAASPKLEFGAYTLRPKIHRVLDEFLEKIPQITKHPYTRPEKKAGTDWPAIPKKLKADSSIPEVDWLKPGEKAAQRSLDFFLKNKLAAYKDTRNDPVQNGQSGLSPYLHFGQISAQRIALEVRKKSPDSEFSKAFLEEMIIRRELSDNFCFYQPNYDRFEGFPAWAQKTLNAHRRDPREYRYTLEQFEQAITHDPLWNAAQRELVRKGKMHGYMRMYWAKKILEWSPSPELALRVAISLNDRYELDGRDPNGYTGIAWSIGGVHDRAWGERPVFGKIRYMSYRGMQSKFDIQAYIKLNA
jgi:deoxyribodipyrimidine photo-lyase